MSTRKGPQRTPGTIHMSRNVFDRLEGPRHLEPAVIPYAETQPEWVAPIRHEHVSIVTPSGLHCHFRRAPRAELERHGQWEKQGADTLTMLSVRHEDGTNAVNARLDDVLTELCIGHDEVLWIDERALGFTPHTVMRQDDHGQDFEVETCSSRHAAAEHVRAFEAAAHKQHYWLVPAPTHDPASLAYSVANMETLQRLLDGDRWQAAWEAVEAMNDPIEDVAAVVWDHMYSINLLYEPFHVAARLSKRRARDEQPPLERVERILELWREWTDTREAAAREQAHRTGAPTPFAGTPGRLRGTYAVLPWKLFDTTPGHYDRAEPEHGLLVGGGELIQYEYKSFVTPTGVFCMLRRATEGELKLFGWWDREDNNCSAHLMLDYPTDLDERDVPRVMGRLLDDALTGLHVSPDRVIWSSPDLEFVPHNVMRQDDNGHDYEVETFPSRHAAAARMRALDALTHKQHYWVTPA